MAGPTIVCVSANPAMDRRLRVRSLSVGAVNRAFSAEGFAGGKAAHVAMAARALGAAAAWVGFLGGAIGQECERQLQALDIQVAAIPSAASTRVNLEIIDESGRVTEILEPGALPSAQEAGNLLRTCVRGIREQWKPAVVVISGSLPAGLGADLYTALIEAARAANAKVFVDTSGEALRESAKARPDFVKVNRAEAEALLERKLAAMQDLILATREIVSGGAGSAAITLGREGLIWLERKDGPLWHARPPEMKAISAVGSGDATLAGFAHAASHGMAGEDALRLAAACGAANCVALAPGRIELASVQALAPQLEVQQLSQSVD